MRWLKNQEAVWYSNENERYFLALLDSAEIQIGHKLYCIVKLP